VWFNQIPVAVGLAATKDGKRCVDLICRVAKGKYDFIELKCPRPGPKKFGETPLGAGLELLKYAAAYVFVVRHLDEIKQLDWSPKIEDEIAANEEADPKDRLAEIAEPWELLKAREITLCVLAPKYVYAGYQLDWLAKAINQDLKSFVANYLPQLSMTFRFEYFDFDRLFANRDGCSKTLEFVLDRILVPEDWSRLG
jgi:hypothetical protein